MSLQNIYFLVGGVGFVAAAICAIAAAILFVRGNIRGVLAELSGKARQSELAEFSSAKRTSASARRNVLTQDDGWKGIVSKGELSETGGSSTGEGSRADSGTGSGAGSDWSFSEQASALASAVAAQAGDGSAARVDASPANHGADSADADASQGGSRDAAAAEAAPTAPAAARGSFAVLRSVVDAHSPNVIDEAGAEIAYEGSAAREGGGR